MNLFAYEYIYGDNADVIRITREKYPWITPRGALVAKARMRDACGEDWRNLDSITMVAFRLWISGTVKVFLIGHMSPESSHKTYDAILRLDSEADPNFDINTAPVAGRAG